MSYPYELVNNLTTDDATKGLSAAQGVVLESEVSQLRSEVHRIAIPVTESGKAIILSGGVGTTIPAPSTSSYSYSRFPVNPGDYVIVNGTGGSGPRLWGFIDSSEKILSVATAGLTGVNLKLVAPENSAEVIINNNNPSAVSYYLSKSSSEAEISIIKEKEDDMNIRYLNDVESNLQLEIGGIDTVTGSDTSASNRARTKGYICTPIVIESNSGYKLRILLRYQRQADGSIAFVNYVTLLSDSAYFYEPEYLHRLVFYKTDESNISQSDLSGIVKTFSGVSSMLPILSRKVVRLKFIGTSGSLNPGEYGFRSDMKKLRFSTGGVTVVDAPLYMDAVYICNNEIFVYNGDTLVSANSQEAASLAELQSQINAINNELHPTPSVCVVESGGIQTWSPGDNVTNDARARTADYLDAPFKITVNEGYKIRLFVKYTKVGDTYTFVEYLRAGGRVLELYDDSFVYRAVFNKDDDTETIAESELDDIVSEYVATDEMNKKVEEMKEARRLSTLYISCLNLPKYPTYTLLIAGYDSLVSKYPNIISKNTLGQTALGTNIYEYVISSGAYNSAGRRGTRDATIAKPKALLVTGIHGYEPGSPMGTFTMVKEFLSGVPALGKLRKLELHIIPCANPDGYNAGTRTNSNGVDINRNFNNNWELEGTGTAYYSGPSAASENETQIVQTWIDNNTDAEFVIDFHQSSYNEEISCLGLTKLYNVTGETDFKKAYLKMTRRIANMLVSERGISYDSIFGYTYDEVTTKHGLSNNYIAGKGLKGGCLEVPEKISGYVNSEPTISVAADIIGNLLIEYADKYGLD